MHIQRSSGVLLHVSSLPGGRLGPRGVPLRRLARRGGASRGGSCCRSGRRTGPARRTRRRRRSPRTPGCLERAATRGSRPDELEAFVARQRYWIADWAAFAGRGAIADQVRFDREWSALRRYAAERGVRLIGDVPIYVAQRRRRRRVPPGALPDGTSSRARRRTALSAIGQLWGNPLYDWTRDCAAGLPLVDRALPPDVRARRRRAHRPLPRLRLLLGGAASTTRRRKHGHWRRGPGARALRRGRAGARRRCRWSPRTSA